MVKKKLFVLLSTRKKPVFFHILTGLLFCCFALISCSEKPYYQKTYDFKEHQWSSEQSTSFQIDVEDTTSFYRFVLIVRTSTDYEHSNLWLRWQSITPQKDTVSEPFELKIADPQGNWIGKKTGSIIENQLTFSERKMPNKGRYIFSIQQASSQKTLKNVLDIGLNIYKTRDNSKEKVNNRSKKKKGK